MALGFSFFCERVARSQFSKLNFIYQEAAALVRGEA
jgi:hypothetical protein